MINMNNQKLTKEELEIIKNLNTPTKIQNFINKLKPNFEDDGKGETCMSPRNVLKTGKCHCIEGAFFAAACFWINKMGKPIVIDLIGEEGDWDHVIAVFKRHGKFGAISKTNHGVLRYREPVYANIRELVMSYFHEYMDDRALGRKTLRKYSVPIDLSVFGKDWVTSEDNLWHIHDYLDSVKHFDILNKEQLRELRKGDDIEIKIGQVVEIKRPKKIKKK